MLTTPAAPLHRRGQPAPRGLAPAAPASRRPSQSHDPAIHKRRPEVLSELKDLEEGFGIEPARPVLADVDALLERAARAAQVPVSGTPATIKATRNQRVPVFASSDPVSEVVTQLPGGTEVRLLGAENEMARIQLPDGVEGWTPERYLR